MKERCGRCGRHDPTVTQRRVRERAPEAGSGSEHRSLGS